MEKMEKEEKEKKEKAKAEKEQEARDTQALAAASTLVGFALFTVTLPVSLLGGNEDEAAEKLVRAPARSTFLRCLGCTPAQHDQLVAEKKTRKAQEK